MTAADDARKHALKVGVRRALIVDERGVSRTLSDLELSLGYKLVDLGDGGLVGEACSADLAAELLGASVETTSVRLRHTARRAIAAAFRSLEQAGVLEVLAQAHSRRRYRLLEPPPAPVDPSTWAAPETTAHARKHR